MLIQPEAIDAFESIFSRAESGFVIGVIIGHRIHNRIIGIYVNHIHFLFMISLSAIMTIYIFYNQNSKR